MYFMKLQSEFVSMLDHTVLRYLSGYDYKEIVDWLFELVELDVFNSRRGRICVGDDDYLDIFVNSKEELYTALNDNPSANVIRLNFDNDIHLEFNIKSNYIKVEVPYKWLYKYDDFRLLEQKLNINVLDSQTLSNLAHKDKISEDELVVQRNYYFSNFPFSGLNIKVLLESLRNLKDIEEVTNCCIITGRVSYPDYIIDADLDIDVFWREVEAAHIDNKASNISLSLEYKGHPFIIKLSTVYFLIRCSKNSLDILTELEVILSSHLDFAAIFLPNNVVSEDANSIIYESYAESGEKKRYYISAFSKFRFYLCNAVWFLYDCTELEGFEFVCYYIKIKSMKLGNKIVEPLDRDILLQKCEQPGFNGVELHLEKGGYHFGINFDIERQRLSAFVEFNDDCDYGSKLDVIKDKISSCISNFNSPFCEFNEETDKLIVTDDDSFENCYIGLLNYLEKHDYIVCGLYKRVNVGYGGKNYLIKVSSGNKFSGVLKLKRNELLLDVGRTNVFRNINYLDFNEKYIYALNYGNECERLIYVLSPDEKMLVISMNEARTTTPYGFQDYELTANFQPYVYTSLYETFNA